MKDRLLCDEGQRTIALVFDQEEEVVSSLRNYAAEHALAACSFTAIGAFQTAILGYFDRERKDYQKIPIDEQVEVLSLVGNISQKDGHPKIHAHVVVGKKDGTAHGGHLLAAYVWPTLEVVITETPDYLVRTQDEETGLALLNLGED